MKKKVELIKASTGASHRKLTEQFQIGKTQVGSILKHKVEFFTADKENQGSARKRICVCSEHEELDQLVWQWFQKAQGMNLPISGPLIQERARTYSRSLNLEFKGSNGWLQRFQDRHNIHICVISGVAGAVDKNTVDEWEQRLHDLLSGYNERDIYNMDETGSFLRALPDKTLAVQNEECPGGKRSKERITASLCVYMAGEFAKPLVIGKAQTSEILFSSIINQSECCDGKMCNLFSSQ